MPKRMGNKVPATFWADGEPVELMPRVCHNGGVWWNAETRVAGKLIGATSLTWQGALDALSLLIRIKMKDYIR